MSIYLFTSQMFVITTLLEFAIVLLLKQKFENIKGDTKSAGLVYIDKNQIDRRTRNDDTIAKDIITKKKIKVCMNGCYAKTQCGKICSNASLLTKIDMIVFLLFIFSYLLFNILYWCIYLQI